MKFYFFLILSLLFSSSGLAQGSGNAAEFNGSNHIDLDTSFLNLVFPITITHWVKNNDASTASLFSSNQHPTGYSGVITKILPGGVVEAYFADGSGFFSGSRRSVYSSNTYNFNGWFHLAFVMISQTNMLIYVNGIQVSTSYGGSGGTYFENPTGNGAFARIYVGNGWDYFIGELDDFTIWDKALSATEIRNLVCRKTNGGASQLLGYFNFDNSVGNVVTDLSPNAHVGTLVNAVGNPTSGAFIGDTSYYSYVNSGISSFAQTLTTGTQIEVSSISSNTPGVQVYEVLSAPNSTFGLPANASLQNYFGIFLAREDNSNKTFRLKINNYNSGMSVFQRSGNDDNIWTAITPTSVVGTVAEFPIHANFKEYYIHEIKNCRIDLGPDIDTCFPINMWIKDLHFNTAKSYTWNGTTVADSIQITAPGTYFVEMDSLGCALVDTIVIFEKKVSVDLGPDITTCNPTAVWIKDLRFHPSKTYTWNGTTVADSIQISAHQTVYVAVDSAGCSAFDTLEISPLAIAIDLGPDREICANNPIWISDIYFNSAKTYSWGNGSTADSVQVFSTQQITVVVDSAGCLAYDTVNVSYENYPVPVFESQIEKCVETPLNVVFPTGDYSFLWPNGSTFNSYTIRAEDELNFYTISPCDDSTLHTISIIQNVCDNPCYIFVPNSFTPNGDTKNDEFSIGVNCEITYFSIQIFNRWGNIVYHSENPYFEWGGEFESRVLAEGVYVYVIRYSGFDKEMKTKNGVIHLLK